MPHFTRLIATTTGAAALAIALAHPAAANVAVGSDNDAGSTDLRPLSVTAQAAVLTRNADGTRNVAYSCLSNGAGDIVAINVRCVIRVNGVNVSEAETTLPAAGGAASAAANAEFSVAAGLLQVCFRATGYYVNGDRKDLNSKCATVSAIV